MKCLWVAGTCSFLTAVVMLALLPCVLPAPLDAKETNGGVAQAAARPDAATGPAQGPSVVVSEAGQPMAVPATFTVNEPREVGRLYVDEQGRLLFKGNADASAKAFFDALSKHMEAQRASAAQP
jgi:hypothetical protein